MQIVTLTTDWRNGDYYIANLKARILSLVADVTIVDITHFISPFNTLQAAFVLKNSYQNFPKGSIHLIGVNSEPSAKNPMVALKADGHYFIGANDGMFDLMLSVKPEIVISLPFNLKNGTGFKSLELFSKCTEAICKGLNLAEIGETCELKSDLKSKPIYNDASITGRIIYIDSFGNAISNIDKNLFTKIVKNRRFEIFVQNNYVKTSVISNYYDDVKSGGLLAIFNSLNLLELAINKGNIAQLESLDTKSTIIIKFYES